VYKNDGWPWYAIVPDSLGWNGFAKNDGFGGPCHLGGSWIDQLNYSFGPDKVEWLASMAEV